MARPTKFSKEQKERAIKMRNDGYMWRVIADELGVTRDMILYHCFDGRKEQVQKAVKKYQSSNYQRVRDKQKLYVDNSKIQQENTRVSVEESRVSKENMEGLDTDN